jgi:hypothetical protein
MGGTFSKIGNRPVKKMCKYLRVKVKVYGTIIV